MTRAIFFDTFSGISGDMTVGALLHAGMPFDYLQGELAKLKLSNFQLDYEVVGQDKISGGKFNVTVVRPELEEHRSVTTIRGLIDASDLVAPVKERAKLIFTTLSQAEGKVHGVPADEVHFHEVGAVDAIIDIVGACIGFDYFGVVEFYCGPLPVGSGFVRAAHGLMPVPAPATLELLAASGATLAPSITLGDGTPYPARTEMVTPTGAALVASLCRFQQPALQLQAVGYGYGTKTFPWLNAMRVWLGQTSTAPAHSYQHHDHSHEHHNHHIHN